MFKKPYTAKPAAPLRSSERRQLIAQLANDFHIEPELAKTLLPEGVLSGKALTHLDEPCTILSSPDGDPLFVRRGKGNDGLLFPTVYTLLKARKMLPLLETPAFVVEKLRDGADLFQGGLSPESLAGLPQMPEGALVGISSVDDTVTPRAIGQLACDSRLITKNGKGKAVLTLHAQGDWLWNSGSRSEPHDITPAGSTSRAPSDDPAPADATMKAQAAEAPSGLVLVFSPEEVDAILRTALVLAIKRTLSKDPRAFPIPASSVYSGHVLPCRPAGDGADVDIKRSSFKKLTAFMKSAQKDGLLTMKETKADVLILSVKADHPDVVAQAPYKTVADAAKQASKQDEPPSTNKAINVTEMYAPHGATIGFWSAAGHSGDDLLSAHDVRTSFSQYITKHSLAYKADGKYIKPDETISALLPERAEAALDVVSRSEALDAILAGMQRWHLFDNPAEAEPKKRKGPGPRIEIAVKQRKGRNVVSVITGFEPYMLEPHESAAALQIICSTSTTVNELQQSTAKKPLHEITVQGDQIKLVTQYLIDHGVPKAYIDAVPLKRK